MPAIFFAARWNGARDGTVPLPDRFHGRKEQSMMDECDHWLVQRRVNDRYWACVDCDAEFRPVQPTTNEIVRRALGRLGLEES
jgi:hypothetical protein